MQPGTADGPGRRSDELPLDSPASSDVRATVARLDAAYRFDEAHRRLILIRHAEPVPSAGGPYDPELSARGRRQAHALARRLAQTVASNDVAVVASPRRRASETGAIVGEQLGVAPIEVAAVAEVGGLGAPTPLVVADRSQVVPRFSWAEPDGPFRPRAAAGVGEVLERTSARDVVVVTHGGFINAYMAEILELDGEFFFYPRHTSLTVVRVRDEAVVLDRLNDAAHLEGEAATDAVHHGERNDG